MPAVFGKKDKQNELIANINRVFNTVMDRYHLSPGDFPDITRFRENLRRWDFTKFPKINMRLIEDVENAMKGMFKPVFKEVEMGRISVRNTFKISGVGTIAGAYVQDGKVTRSAQVRVVRDGVVVYDGKISSLKRFKDDVKEVAAGYECGISFENFNDIHEGDVIEAYTMEQVER